MTGNSGWRWLTLPLSVLVAAASIVGLAVPGLYAGPASWAAQGRAQDFMDLVIVLPALVVSALLAARGSVRGHLVWLGALSYLVSVVQILVLAWYLGRMAPAGKAA